MHVWWDEPADGPTNMAADECLAAEADRRGSLIVRLYGWTATTVSLGAFQRIEEARGVPSIVGMPLVRRPSGGGAIVHGGDLTYAAAVPRSHPWGGAPQMLYDTLHEAMAEALAAFGIQARRWLPGDHAPPSTAGAAEPFFCFDRRSSGDLVVVSAARAPGFPPKVMGSAQRRLAAVVLQHGSLLLRHGDDVTGNARHPSLEELRPGAFGTSTRRALAEAWLARVAERLTGDTITEPSPWSRGLGAGEVERANRFRDDRWTTRR